MKAITLKEEGKPVIYINEETGKGVIVNKARITHRGSIQIKAGVYKYFQYREGKKVIQKYLGRI